MKNILIILTILISSFNVKAQKQEIIKKLNAESTKEYKKELDSLSKVFKIKNACGLMKTFIDNGIVPPRESVTIYFKDANGEIKQQFLYTRDIY